MTLGDLCRCTEPELLASKNFGETSLVEIKEMLGTKGLRLGQMAQDRQAEEIFEPESLSPDEQALLGRSISELNLSVRARKCMTRLANQHPGRPAQADRRRFARMQELRRYQPSTRFVKSSPPSVSSCAANSPGRSALGGKARKRKTGAPSFERPAI